MKPIKLAFITDGDAKDVHRWSGIITNIANALEKQKEIEIYYIENLGYKRNFFLLVLGKIFSIILKIFGKKYFYGWTINIAKKYAKVLEKKLPEDIDVIFATSGCTAATALGFIQSKCKKIFYCDTTLIDLFNYYPNFDNVYSKSLKEIYNIEKKKFDNGDLFLFASDWAANNAINTFNVNPQKIKIVPFGANIETEYHLTEIRNIVKNRSTDKCKLLFVGLDWKRKGGDITFEIAKELHLQNINVHLDIVGIKDIPITLPDYVTNHGFISKKTEEGRNILTKLYEEAHFFILPTQQECFGVVYAEASSFAVPSLATKTGGVTTAVKDNINGMTFDLNDTPKKYAEYIKTLFNNKEEYEKLCLSAFNDYETRLNWDVAAKEIIAAIREIL